MSSPLHVLVCGGRRYHEERHLFRALDMLRPTLIMTGGAPGADRLAEKWAKNRNVPCRVFKADWASHGRGAGPKRNQQMLDVGQPDLVIAFPGGDDTADMVRRAWRSGVRVVEASAEPERRANTND